MIPVTKPFLPPSEEYKKRLDGIWERVWLTNMGPLANELELKLKQHLQVKGLLFVTNGTLALQMAIKALDLRGGIITTPFSFIATTSSIVWEGCRPIFVDIDEESLNIDTAKIEAAITEDTTAILVSHIYGNACEVEQIKEIADKYKLKVIYDGAQAFGVRINGKSVFEYGDISICSLHATKIYHSVEGGLLISSNESLRKKLAFMRNFGFNGPETFAELGINGKNSEFHAAMGLVNLEHINEIHEKRKALTQRYDNNLQQLRARKPTCNPQGTKNYAYYPLIFEEEELMLRCIEKLKEKEIFSRRYFYPSLAKSVPYLELEEHPVTDDIARRVLCLPLYFDLSMEEVDLICDLVLDTQTHTRKDENIAVSNS